MVDNNTVEDQRSKYDILFEILASGIVLDNERFQSSEPRNLWLLSFDIKGGLKLIYSQTDLEYNGIKLSLTFK